MIGTAATITGNTVKGQATYVQAIFTLVFSTLTLVCYSLASIKALLMVNLTLLINQSILCILKFRHHQVLNCLVVMTTSVNKQSYMHTSHSGQN